MREKLKAEFDKLPPEEEKVETPTAQATPNQSTPQIDWLDRSRQLLQEQKHLTTNRLLNKSNRNLDDIHVPLGLIERKEPPKMKGDRSLEKYLKKKWLKKVCEDNFDAAWEDWKRLRQHGRVWLLLDGLD